MILLIGNYKFAVVNVIYADSRIDLKHKFFNFLTNGMIIYACLGYAIHNVTYDPENGLISDVFICVAKYEKHFQSPGAFYVVYMFVRV